MKKITFLTAFCLSFTYLFAQQDSVRNTVSGRAYPVVKIGTQTWMAENVADSIYDTQSEAYGDTLPCFRHVHDYKKEQPYCVDFRLLNDTKKPATGRLLTDSLRQHLGLRYNWAGLTGWPYEKQTYYSFEQETPRQGICPNGYHIPTTKEFKKLIDYVENNPFVLMDSLGWILGKGTNSTGFNALPNGRHSIDETVFTQLGTVARFATATPYYNGQNYYFYQIKTDTVAQTAEFNTSNTMNWNTSACRCVKNPENVQTSLENATNRVAVFAKNRQIIIESETPEEVTCADILGHTVYKGFATIIPLNNSGIYIVKIGNSTKKVVVK